MNPYRTLLPLYDYVLGFYLFRYPLSKKARRLIYAAGLIGLLGHAGADLLAFRIDRRGQLRLYFQCVARRACHDLCDFRVL